MMHKIRVGILFGGISGEHEVSLMSARSVLQAISKEKYDVIQIGITQDGHWVSGDNALDHLERGQHDGLQTVFMFPKPDHGRLYSQNNGSVARLSDLDILFPLLHGTFGEDGNLQGYMELMDLPYVGANVAASAVCMDKSLFKGLMRSHGLPVVDAVKVSRDVVTQKMTQTIEQIESTLAYPLFVKPSSLGSSVGISKCHDREELVKGLFFAGQFGENMLIEQGVDAIEIEVGVLGNESDVQVSIPGEVRYDDTFYSYQAKYHDVKTELIIPAPLSKDQSETVCNLAGQAFKAVGCRGMARVDFLIDRHNNEIYISELNTIPGFTQTSMFPRLWEHSGVPFPQLIDRLIDQAFEQHEQKMKTSFRYHK